MKENYREEKHTELFDKLGVFFAFSNEQFKEGLEKAGGVEVTGKYTDVGQGMLCPSKNVKALISGFDEIKADWEKERQKVEQVKLIFVGIDSWNRPVWKAPDRERAYYGSVNELFDDGSTEDEVLKKVDTYGLCYMGEHFGCEPMGTSVPDEYYI